jgi:hypothetical protein
MSIRDGMGRDQCATNLRADNPFAAVLSRIPPGIDISSALNQKEDNGNIGVVATSCVDRLNSIDDRVDRLTIVECKLDKTYLGAQKKHHEAVSKRAMELLSHSRHYFLGPILPKTTDMNKREGEFKGEMQQRGVADRAKLKARGTTPICPCMEQEKGKDHEWSKKERNKGVRSRKVEDRESTRISIHKTQHVGMDGSWLPCSFLKMGANWDVRQTSLAPPDDAKAIWLLSIAKPPCASIVL